MVETEAAAAGSQGGLGGVISGRAGRGGGGNELALRIVAIVGGEAGALSRVATKKPASFIPMWE